MLVIHLQRRTWDVMKIHLTWPVQFPGGPVAAAQSCVGFGLFSLVFDHLGGGAAQAAALVATQRQVQQCPETCLAHRTIAFCTSTIYCAALSSCSHFKIPKGAVLEYISLLLDARARDRGCARFNSLSTRMPISHVTQCLLRFEWRRVLGSPSSRNRS